PRSNEQNGRSRRSLGIEDGGKAAAPSRGSSDATTTASAAVEAPSAFGTWLSRARLEKRMSVAELAESSGVSGPAIYNIESGRIANPRAETVRRLEKGLGQDLPTEAKEELKEESTIEGVGEFVDFDPHDAEDRPAVSGVYVLYDISERPIYVGEGGSIRKRIKDHEEKFWFKQPIVETAAYVKIDDEALRNKVETVLIRFLKSNAVINKKNVDR